MGARGEEKLESESLLAARRWQFGAAVLDERSLTLSVDQQPVELERKPLEVLLHLLHHAGEVVTKDELLAAVWPGRVLSDSALTSCMHKLREALRDEQQEIIRTQHGFGYRLVAPVKVEASSAPAPPRFDFKAGDHPPGRPQWSLVERLGSGGHGEAWLARHDKTREQRVFKFAADGAGLASLKREITLSRLLHDALGGRRDIGRIIDWNLEDAPYFIESGWSQSGSLVGWAKGQGGADKVPLATRLELAAQIAEALAAAHSVGVLHKDLKPSNVLVELDDDGKPRIKLADFGSGAVLDPERLEQMGITRMGFTQAVPASSGTPMYLAPEVISGQPFTIQSDIYALGVVLYQLVVGDLAKPLAPGWEREVPDELLREDIASTAEGQPERRLGDAARMAQRLRSLDERRRLREAEHRARAEAEHARLEVERSRARRMWVRLTIAASVAGALISTALLVDARRARDAARASAATSKAVIAFLSEDMLAQIGGDQRPLKDLTLREVLDRAAQQVDSRFGGNPDAAAEVHQALGASYLALDDESGAVHNLDRALTLLEQNGRTGSELAADTVARLASLKSVLGDLAKELPRYRSVQAAVRRELGATHPKTINLGTQLAFGLYLEGAYQDSAADLQQLLADASAVREPDPALLANVEQYLGRAQMQLAEYAEAERHLRSALTRLSGGAESLQRAQTRTSLAAVLAETGKYDEADREITTAIDAASRWAPNESAGYLVSARLVLGRLRAEQGRLAEAAGLFEEIVHGLEAYTGPGQDQSAIVRRPLAEVYQRQHRPREALAQLHKALAAEDPKDILFVRVRIILADVLREQGDADGARAALAGIDAGTMATLPPRHPMLGERRRVEGLLAAAAHRYDEARRALTEARDILAFRLGEQHWRTARVRAELDKLPARGAEG